VSDFIDFTVSDAELEIKKRARRRLVGASVLALLAVIVLPLALRNSEEPHAVPDMRVSIPDRAEFEPPRPENDSDSVGVVIEPDAASGTSGLPVDNAPSSLPESASKPPASTPPEQPAARSPEKDKNVVEKDAETARVLALLDGKSPAKEADKDASKAQGQVFIQVGAFGNADRAAKQVKELNGQGFAAYAEKAGKVTRVRIGPLPRNEGEQVVTRLKAQGHKAVLSSR
jgi:DedD protein